MKGGGQDPVRYPREDADKTKWAPDQELRREGHRLVCRSREAYTGLKILRLSCQDQVA